MKGLLSLALVFIIISCSKDTSVKEKLKKSNEIPIEVFETEYNTLGIVNIRGCDYLLWFNSYGSNMVHCGDCSNKIHEFSNAVNQ